MEIRRAINENKPVGLAAAVVLLLAAIGFIWSSTRQATASLPPRMYFSDDDGKTYFADDSGKVPPFDHNGKPAYLANVFLCAGGQPFVGFLLRYTPKGKEELENMSVSQRNGSDMSVNNLKKMESQVKLPGQKRWTGYGDAWEGLIKPACPDGLHGIPQPEMPQ